MPIPTYRPCRLIRNVNHLIRRELKIDPRFAVVKEVSYEELMVDLEGAFARILMEQREDGVGVDITITRNLGLTIGGEIGTWDLYGFPRSTNVYIVNAHDHTIVYKAD